jgi:arsenite methyltransferase
MCKAYYRPELSLEEMNHINFDWYAPRNAFRQTPDEVRAWCCRAGLEIERDTMEEAGITVIARKEN